MNHRDAENTGRLFPVMLPSQDYNRKRVKNPGLPECPTVIDWEMLAQHEAQAQCNHSQTLECLAQRGGLAPDEILAVIEDRAWHFIEHTESIRLVTQHIAAWRNE